jgi:hypothetical protein
MAKISTIAAQRIIYGLDSKARQLVEDNAALPANHPDLTIIRFYAAASLAEKTAFWAQLCSALEDTPLLKIYPVRR